MCDQFSVNEIMFTYCNGSLKEIYEINNCKTFADTVNK